MSEESPDEEVIEGALGPDPLKLAEWQGPTQHRIKTKQRIREIEDWIKSQGYVDYEAILAYIGKRWSLNRQQQKEYAKEVIEDFSRLGKVFGQHPNEKRYER